MNTLSQQLATLSNAKLLLDPDSLKHFASDASCFFRTPQAIVIPSTVTDIKKILQYYFENAHSSPPPAIVIRGKGTNHLGSALSPDVIIRTPEHLNHVIDFDTASHQVTVEAGIMYSDLNAYLSNHYQYSIPINPIEKNYSTLGGIIATHAQGPRSLSFDSLLSLTHQLSVICANGETLNFSSLSHSELQHKLRAQNFEGELYRSIIALLQKEKSTIEQMTTSSPYHKIPYNLHMVANDNFTNLIPLFFGSEGTLGVIHTATIQTIQRFPYSARIHAYCENYGSLMTLINELRASQPLSISFFDNTITQLVKKINRQPLANIEHLIPEKTDGILCIVEYASDDIATVMNHIEHSWLSMKGNARTQKTVYSQKEQQETINFINQSAYLIHQSHHRSEQPLLQLEELCVTTGSVGASAAALQATATQYQSSIAFWGYAVSHGLHLQPLLLPPSRYSPSTIIDCIDQLHIIAENHGALTSPNGAAGLLSSPTRAQEFLTTAIRKIFDPFETLNPYVKKNHTRDMLYKFLPPEYNGSYR